MMLDTYLHMQNWELEGEVSFWLVIRTDDRAMSECMIDTSTLVSGAAGLNGHRQDMVIRYGI